jgi:MFS family permease
MQSEPEGAAGAESARTTLASSLALLRTRRFGTFWFASLLSSIGTWAQQVAQPWLLLTLGASPALIGLDAFAMSAPVWLLTLAGGYLADHGDRRRVIAGFQSAQMLCPLIIVALLIAGNIRPWMIIALSLVVGITDALSMPSFSSIVPSIVERRQIGAGLALNATQFNISRILGPALAGVLMAGAGVLGCFVASAISYLPFIGVALWILPHGRNGAAAAARAPPRHPFAELAAISRDPGTRGALLTTFSASLLCGPVVAFCPVLVKQAFAGTATQFSFAVSAFGCGGVLGAIGLLAVNARHDRRLLGSGFAMLLALILAAIALAPWFWALVVLLVAAGLTLSATNIATNTLVQSSFAPGKQGQAVSLYMLAMRGGLAVGSLATGVSAHFLGIRAALLIDGLLALAAQLWIRRGWLQAPRAV